VAQRDGTALGADPVGGQPECVAAGQHLAGEGFVELDRVELVQGETGTFQREPRRGNHPEAGTVGVDAGGRRRQHAEPGDGKLPVGVPVDDQHRCGAVVDAAGVAGGDGALRTERGWEPSQAFASQADTRPVVLPDARDRHDLGVEQP
jgi:hypothetical protein